MNRRQAIYAHRKRLARLTDIQARNLMEHAANKTPLLPADSFGDTYVTYEGLC